jgi:hypothetical protein
MSLDYTCDVLCLLNYVCTLNCSFRIKMKLASLSSVSLSVDFWKKKLSGFLDTSHGGH